MNFSGWLAGQLKATGVLPRKDFFPLIIMLRWRFSVVEIDCLYGLQKKRVEEPKFDSLGRVAERKGFYI